MATILECLIEKARNRIVSAKSVQDLERHLQSAQGSELEAAQAALEESKILLHNRLSAANKHAARVEQYSSIIEQASAKGIPTAKILRAITLGDDADTFKHGFIARSAREVVEGYQGHFLARAVDAFEQLMPKGFFKLQRNPSFDKEAVEELFDLAKGVKTSSRSQAARETAKVINDLHLEGGQTFQNSGGNIRLMEGHALGDSSSTEMVSKLGKDAWLKLAKTSFDRDFLARSLGQQSIPDEVWDKALTELYANKVSGGLSRLGDWIPQGLRSTLNARSHHRMFRFTDANAYINYHEQLGGIDLYSATKHYAESIGRDIGILEALGPRPQALENALLRQVGESDPAKLGTLQKTFSRDLRYVTKNYIGSKDPDVDRWLGTVTSLRVAGSLATTVVDAASIEKLGLSKIAGHIRGLPLLQTYAQDLKMLKNSSQTNKEVYKELAKQAMHLDAYIDESANALRSQAADGGHRWARTSAQVVLKGTGLVDATNGTRAAAVRSMSMEFGEKSWAEVSPNFKDYFLKLGIDEQMFNRIKEFGTTPIVDGHGLNGVSVQQLFDAGKTEEALALSAAVNRQVEAAAPTISHRAASWFDDLSRQGIVPQILSANTRTFMGYPLSFWDNHIKVLGNVPGLGKKAAYLGAYTVTLATLGSISTMIKDVLNGKIPNASADTVLRTFARSGLIPILSDYVLSPSYGTPGYDFAKRLLGVHGATIADTVGGAKSAGSAVLEGKNPGSGLYQIQRALQGMMPGQNAPIIGLLFQRLVLNQLRTFYDSDANKKFNKSVKAMKKEGTEYWWQPGKLLPGQ